MKCDTCIPHVNCDFFRVEIDDPVLEDCMIACPEAARTSACDVVDAVTKLRNSSVNLTDRAAIKAAILADPELDIYARAIAAGQLNTFVERIIRCAARDDTDADLEP
jgi:hypothetical protein